MKYEYKFIEVPLRENGFNILTNPYYSDMITLV